MPNEIIIYWDEQDGDNIGWAYRTESDSGAVEADDLPSAIEETCRLLGANLEEGDFACEPLREVSRCGVAHYTAPDCPECGAQNPMYAEHGHTDGPREYHAACWQTPETAQCSN